MAQPRRIEPGATYLVTRRVSQRTFRLCPALLTNQIMLYCLAWIAAKFGMLVHAIVVMSTHYHLVITDMQGRLPDFLRDLNRSAAKALNASQGQWENLWSGEHASAVLLPTLEDVVDKIAYIAANPVAAALVPTPEQWPGVLRWEPGSSMVVQRPEVYFDPRGSAPESVALQLVAPPGAEGAEGEWAQRVQQAVADKVSRAREEVRKRGLRFLGAAAALQQSFLQRAKSYEEKRRTNPVLAAKDPVVRETYLRIERQFRRAYRTALLAWKAGERLVAFPFGTWWMRVHHGAGVLPATG